MQVVTGPDVAAIGWIAYQAPWRRPVQAAYARHPNWLGLRMMLQTGNRPEPPPGFLGRRMYRDFIDSRNFRAALCLSDVRLLHHGDGRDADLEVRLDDFVGYTPMRMKARPGRLSLDLAWHEKGEGKIWTEVEKHPDSVTLRRTVEFRIGKLGNLGAALLTGYWAPCAWMSIDYTLAVNGRCFVEFRGSLIPSQSIYVNWTRTRRHSMLALTSDEITGFLTTGTNLPAPGRSQYVWSNGPRP